ncbi:transcript variant X4 [Nothobranchius furzeri]|uniref:Transcript variant X4 n=1 Tax=Nothobranchius furzeri TaxID=105023 RepID=A0A9D3BET3_NOTFU|nr:GTPase IMAP family member 4 isoform X4 [Nothobranchius furzeri]KAF7204820.1 transcript variant X4 [Nothobranchius furzeri]
MECQCDKNTEDAVASWWMSGSNAQMGAFAVVGYLLYRFSQTLPALIRWPIRLFCSITGIRSVFRCLSRMWRFMVASSSYFKWVVPIIRIITGSSGEGSQSDSRLNNILDLISGTSKKSDLRLVLLGPRGGGRTSLANTLIGTSETNTSMEALNQSISRCTTMNGRELTVIDTPDILGSSLGSYIRAREALRSLQLTSPGPHAFLLVIQAPGSSMGVNQDPIQAIQSTLELFGEGVTGYIIPVITHADHLKTLDQLLEADPRNLKRALSLCEQRAELVDNRPGLPPEERSSLYSCLVERVIELKEVRGHFIHELQRREDDLREKLLTDMSSALATKLGRM